MEISDSSRRERHIMGRTQRGRCRKNVSKNQEISLGQDKAFQQLVQWMKHNGWTQTGRLIPVDFLTTGRGLKTLQHIACGDTLANIPGKLLMTVETASKSMFGWLFRRRKFLTQQVLAAHLVFERHLGEQSFWAKYIMSLPVNIATPKFTCAELNALPDELSTKVNSFKDNVTGLFKELEECISSDDKCPHCSCFVSEVCTVESFLWAWFIINSRAVYICPERNNDHDLALLDVNCLALAPYLDIFNHSNETKVQAFLSEVDGSYQIRTLTPYKKFSQVFIHYGDHCNLKLYLEYGFIIPRNVHDTLPLTFDDVYTTIVQLDQTNTISKMVYKFLKSHDLLTNIYLSADGLSWSAKALAFVLLSSEKLDPKTIQLKVFSNNYTDSEMSDIVKIGRLLVDKKRFQLQQFLQEMVKAKDSKLSGNVSESFLMAVDLYNEYLNVLNDCEKSLNFPF